MKVYSMDQVDDLSNLLASQEKKVVLAGGCFDILHLGHITFLEKAKEAGDTLIILLESDQSIRRKKGKDRPINSQSTRAKILSHIDLADYLILLPEMESDKEYDELVRKLAPSVIAVTRGDEAIHHKKRQSELVGAKLLEVTEPLLQQSTTLVLETISKEI